MGANFLVYDPGPLYVGSFYISPRINLPNSPLFLTRLHQPKVQNEGRESGNTATSSPFNIRITNTHSWLNGQPSHTITKWTTNNLLRYMYYGVGGGWKKELLEVEWEGENKVNSGSNQTAYEAEWNNMVIKRLWALTHTLLCYYEPSISRHINYSWAASFAIPI